MYCKKCGEKLAEDSNFCEKCGTPISKEEVKTTVEDKKSLLDEVVADLGPDDLDDLMPKKNYALVITIVVITVVIAIGVFIYFDLTTPESAKKGKNIDYQEIIDEYGGTIEQVASDYLLEHELINDFSEIKDLVKYDKHKVSCDNVYINIDGTVYLSECSVDGKKVNEVYGRKKSILTKDSEEVCYAEYSEEKKELEFYFDGEIVSVYECNYSGCDLYETENFKYNSCLDQIAVIQDGDSLYLYNYQAGQEVIEAMSEIAALQEDGKNIGFIIQDEETEKYGYVDTRGTIKLDIEYDALGLISDGKIYDRGINLDKDKIIAAKDGLYGVIKLSSGEEIIPFKYEQIYLGPNDYYVIKEDKYYYLIDSDGNKITDKEYKMIFAFEDILVVNEDNKLKIVDYKGESIIDDELDVLIDYKDKPISGIFGYNATKEDNKIIIEINEATEEGYTTSKYIYDIEDKLLSEEQS